MTKSVKTVKVFTKSVNMGLHIHKSKHTFTSTSRGRKCVNV